MNKIIKSSAFIIPHVFSLGTLGLRSFVSHAIIPLKWGVGLCCGHFLMPLRSLIQRKNLGRESYIISKKTFRRLSGQPGLYCGTIWKKRKPESGCHCPVVLEKTQSDRPDSLKRVFIKDTGCSPLRLITLTEMFYLNWDQPRPWDLIIGNYILKRQFKRMLYILIS